MPNTNYVPAIGLELHLELKTKTKMFCPCLNETWKIGQEELEPNKNICLICLGHPGVLPVINKKAIEMVIKAGLALNCKIREKSKFDRKQYFYPDLPKGYQISQYNEPLCEKGYLLNDLRNIRIRRIHLEEDTGKLTHIEDGSLVDYNRAGIPLMELVTEPDITSGKEAKEFCQELQMIFRELGISDADMEKGQMRCEVNISLSNESRIKTNNSRILGTKVEIKNLNSFKAVERAIDYEIQRQSKLLDQGKKIIQETKGWDEKKQITYSQRTKEESADYRYFPEPDLPPLHFITENTESTKTQKAQKHRKHKNTETIQQFNNNFIDIEKIKRELPELPRQKRQRFTKQFGFKLADAKILTSNPNLADYTEQVISELKVWLTECGQFEGSNEEIWQNNKEKIGKLVSGWLINKLGGFLIVRKLSWQDNTISPENFAEFITMILIRRVSTKNANLLLEKMLETGGDPSNILQVEDLFSARTENLEEIVNQIINKNPDQVEKFKSGKTQLLRYFIGQMMKETKGKADPKEAEEIFLQKLSL